LTGQQGDGKRCATWHALRPRFAPGEAADHRSASVLAFLCSCFPEGLWTKAKDCGEDRPEHDVRPQTEDRSPDGAIAESRRRKTPLVLLPYEGERRGGRVSPNLWNQVLSLEGRDREGLPRRERRKGLGFAKPLEPGPLPRRERQRGSCDAKRGSCDAERESVKSSRPAMDPPCKGAAAWFPPRFDGSLSAGHQQDASPARRLAPPRRALSPIRRGRPSNRCSLQPLIPPQRSGGDRRPPTCVTSPRPCSSSGHVLRQVMFSVRSCSP